MHNAEMGPTREIDVSLPNSNWPAFPFVPSPHLPFPFLPSSPSPFPLLLPYFLFCTLEVGKGKVLFLGNSRKANAFLNEDGFLLGSLKTLMPPGFLTTPRPII